MLKKALGWGVGLWLIGYVLGIVLFMAVPPNMIGWFITPIGIVITLWVLWKKIDGPSLKHYFWVGVAWTVIAVILDYFFLVKLLKPADGYYKLDVYFYYCTTLVLPVLAGWWKLTRKNGQQ